MSDPPTTKRMTTGADERELPPMVTNADRAAVAVIHLAIQYWQGNSYRGAIQVLSDLRVAGYGVKSP